MLYPFFSNAKSKIPIPEKNEKMEIFFCMVLHSFFFFVFLKLFESHKDKFGLVIFQNSY